MLSVLVSTLTPLIASAQLEWRISVKLFTGPGGALPQNPCFDVGGGTCSSNAGGIYQIISNNVALVNGLLDAHRRGYSWRLTEITAVPGSTAPLPADTNAANSWFNLPVSGANQDDLDTQAKGNPGGFAFRNNAINFYFVNATTGPNGGYCAFPTENQDVIIVAPNTFQDVLIHESGHYFGLNHTFNTEQYLNADNTACANKCSCAQLIGGDDGIADTPLDNQCWNQNNIAQATYGQAYALLNSAQQYFVDNTWSNIMSYHSPGNRFTSDQLDVMTDNSNGTRFKVATGRTQFVETTGNDATGDGGSGNPYATVARGITAAAPGDIVLLRGGNYNEPQTITSAVTLRATRGDVSIGSP